MSSNAARTSVQPGLAPNRLGAFSLAFGLASIPLGVYVGVLAAPFWITGIVLGIMGMAQHGPQRRLAVRGLIASICGLVVMVAAITLMMLWFSGYLLYA